MADKEERIFIFTQQKACDICKKNLEEYDGLTPDCGNCSEKEFPSMTRSETIEKMAKEMARRELAKMQPRFNPTKEEYESIWAYEVLPNTQKRFRDQAEAALNALLGVEK